MWGVYFLHEYAQREKHNLVWKTLGVVQRTSCWQTHNVIALLFKKDWKHQYEPMQLITDVFSFEQIKQDLFGLGKQCTRWLITIFLIMF